MAVLSRTSRTFASVSRSKLVARPASLAPRCAYATDSATGQEGSGVVKQTDKNAKPKIIDHTTPEQTSEEVKKHNADFEARPDRAANAIDDQGRPHTGQLPPGGKLHYYTVPHTRPMANVFWRAGGQVDKR